MFTALLTQVSTPFVQDTYFDNTYWVSVAPGILGTWDGSKWNTNIAAYGAGLDLACIGGWNTNYRADLVTLTLDNITGGSGSFEMWFNALNITGASRSDGETIELDLSSLEDDFTHFTIWSETNDLFSVTNIVFVRRNP